MLDVHFHEAAVVRGLAPARGNGLHRARQAGGLHGGAHRHAIGVLLVQPGGVEAAGERRRAQEGGLVALPFLFGKGHDLNAEGQAAPGAVQGLHRDHGHEDAQAAVVAAGVAHGVVVAAGQQIGRAHV